MSETKCEHCGAHCDDEFELDIYHRGCRLSAAFSDLPGGVSTEDGVMKLDMVRIGQAMGIPDHCDNCEVDALSWERGRIKAIELRVSHCPMHAAAPELAEACEAALELIESHLDPSEFAPIVAEEIEAQIKMGIIYFIPLTAPRELSTMVSCLGHRRRQQ